MVGMAVPLGASKLKGVPIFNGKEMVNLKGLLYTRSILQLFMVMCRSSRRNLGIVFQSSLANGSPTILPSNVLPSSSPTTITSTTTRRRNPRGVSHLLRQMMIPPVVKMTLMVIPQVLRMMTPLRRVMAVVTLQTTNCHDVPVSIC